MSWESGHYDQVDHISPAEHFTPPGYFFARIIRIGRPPLAI
jgi:hypothetical protein